MSRASNSLTVSDVLTTPIKLKYSASYESSSFVANGIQVLKGVNGPVTVTGSIPQTTLNYLSIRNLYYSNYLTGSFPISASNADNFLQSTAAGNTDDADIRYFPTESNAEITVLSIPTEIYGQQISRQSFVLSSSQYRIIDDGNGNLKDDTGYLPNCVSYTATKLSTFLVTGQVDYVDCLGVSQSVYVEDPPGTYPITASFYALSGSLSYVDTEVSVSVNSIYTGYHVGNVIYPQGMAIITNPDYQVYFP